VGTGTLFTAPLGEAFVDVDATPAGNWVEIGYSSEGWAFGADFTFEDVPVAEEVDPIFVLKTAQELRVTGAVAQPSLENLQIAMGGGTVVNDPGPPDVDTYTPPAADAFTPLALHLRVDGTDGFVRDFLIQSAINTGAFEMQHAKAPDLTLIALEFRLLKPAAGDIFTVVEANA
jgi:hypothetical protein